MTTWLLVGVAGAVGALVRHEVTTRAPDGLVALHACNVLGALALGVVAGALPTSRVAAALALGGLGSLTSFSTWVVGARGRDPGLHLALPLVLAVGAALVGILAGRWLGGLP